MAFDKFIGSNTTFYGITKREQVIAFLDTKIKTKDEDPDRKWITTWNDYLGDIKFFFRWLHNQRIRSVDEPERDVEDMSDWETPSFVKIKKKKTKRLSPYSTDQIWDRDEVLSIVKYEPSIRNKAAITLFWDLNGRNHEITMLRIANIRLRERYGEGEIPYNTKTGGGPILLTCSFPYVRDWLNRHPFRNSPVSRLICNLHNGAPIKPEAMWTMMKQLRKRIMHMLENGSIIDPKEREKLTYLLRAKKWNPYCLRHSSISSDSDYLPEYALKKKARWSINSRQGARYIKTRMGNDLKRTILAQNGITTEGDEILKKKPAVMICGKCNLVNTIEHKYCTSCSYPLTPQAYEEIKTEEDNKLKAISEKYETEMKSMREEMNQQFTQILSIIQQNPQLAFIKPEALKHKVKSKD